MKTRHFRWGLLAVLLLVAGTCVALRTHANTVWGGDFLPLQLGARCLVRHCDPYKAADLNALSPGTRAILPEAPVYPPSSFMVVAPFAALPVGVAGLVFSAVSAVVFGVALWGLLGRFSAAPQVVVMGVLTVSPALTDALQFGNPAVLAVSLATVAALNPQAWVLLAVALALKPQLAFAVVVWMLLRGETRAAAGKALGAAAVLFAIGLAATAHAAGGLGFVAELRGNLQLATSAGHSMDPSALNEESYSFLNLQPLLVRVHLPQALAMVGALGALLFLRRSRPLTALALLVAATLLAFYQREYGRVVVLLLVPAMAELGQLRWPFAVTAGLWLTSDLLLRHTRFELLPISPVLTVGMAGLLAWSMYVRGAEGAA